MLNLDWSEFVMCFNQVSVSYRLKSSVVTHHYCEVVVEKIFQA